MITQQQWDKFSTHTSYISQNFDRPKILEVVCKCGLEGGLSFFEVWPKGVNDYAYKMRFRKGNGNKGAIFVFNDFCVNNDPFSKLSVAYREYNASIFGLDYALKANVYLQEALSKKCGVYNTQISIIEAKRNTFIKEFTEQNQRLKQIGASVSGEVLREDV